jgi:hypothetical protein
MTLTIELEQEADGCWIAEEGIPVPDWHAREIDRRRATPAQSARPWSEVRAELVVKYNIPE